MNLGSKKSKKIAYIPPFGSVKKSKIYKLVKLGLDFINRNDEKTAIKLFSEAISIDTDKVLQVAALLFKKSYNCWRSLGLSYLNNGYLEHAKLAFENAITLNPDDVKSWYYYGICYLEMNNIPKAVKALEKTVKKGSSLIESTMYMQKAFKKSGNKKRLESIYITSLSIVETVADAWEKLKELYDIAGLKKRAALAKIKVDEYRNLYATIRNQLS